jgi:phosphatidylglycerophosphate synthase
MNIRQSDPGRVAISFPDATSANHRIAGVAAAGRAVRQAIDGGAEAVWLVIGDLGPLDGAARRDVERLRGDVPVTLASADETPVAAMPAAVPSARAVLLATGKASDGLISRWLNRPVSRAISALLLRYTDLKPVHATLGNAAIALAMVAALLFGGASGLIAGGLLFHAASVFDGVDGEMARATWRSSRAGASLDSVVDVLTNLGFVLGLTYNLTASHGRLAFVLGGLSLCLLLIGFALVGRRSRRAEGQLRFEWLKQQVDTRSAGTSIVWLARVGTFLTTRDSIAFFFMFMTVAGLAMPALCTLALASTIWVIVLLATLAAAPARSREISRRSPAALPENRESSPRARPR